VSVPSVEITGRVAVPVTFMRMRCVTWQGRFADLDQACHESVFEQAIHLILVFCVDKLDRSPRFRDGRGRVRALSVSERLLAGPAVAYERGDVARQIEDRKQSSALWRWRSSTGTQVPGAGVETRSGISSRDCRCRQIFSDSAMSSLAPFDPSACLAMVLTVRGRPCCEAGP